MVLVPFHGVLRRLQEPSPSKPAETGPKLACPTVRCSEFSWGTIMAGRGCKRASTYRLDALMRFPGTTVANLPIRLRESQAQPPPRDSARLARLSVYRVSCWYVHTIHKATAFTPPLHMDEPARHRHTPAAPVQFHVVELQPDPATYAVDCRDAEYVAQQHVAHMPRKARCRWGSGPSCRFRLVVKTNDWS